MSGQTTVLLSCWLKMIPYYKEVSAIELGERGILEEHLLMVIFKTLLWAGLLQPERPSWVMGLADWSAIPLARPSWVMVLGLVLFLK